MKTEEAIKWLEEAIQDAKEFFDQCSPELQKEITEQEEVFKIAISTLHAGSDIGESPAHIDRSKWEPCKFCGQIIDELDLYGWLDGIFYAGYCKQLAVDDFFELETDNAKFCPECGRPLTEEAWIELERRLRGNE